MRSLCAEEILRRRVQHELWVWVVDMFRLVFRLARRPSGEAESKNEKKESYLAYGRYTPL